MQESSENHGIPTAIAEPTESNELSEAHPRRNLIREVLSSATGGWASAKEQLSGEGQQGKLEKIRNFSVEFGPSRKDILNFTNQLAVMIRAGRIHLSQ